MNIVHVSVSSIPVLYQYGGAIQRRIFEVAREQVRRGDCVTIYSVGPKTELREVAGVKVQYISCRAILPWRHFEFQLRTKGFMRTRSDNVDVLFFHSQPEGAVLNRHRRARTFLWYDFYRFRRSNFTPLCYLYRTCLSRFDLLLPVSEYCKSKSCDFWKMPSHKFEVVYNGVNLEQFRPDEKLRLETRRTLSISKRVLLYVGRVCRQKGIDVLLHAARSLNSRRNDIQLTVAGPIAQFGSDVDPENWSKRIREVGGIYLGPVEEPKLSAVYNVADVFVMPTRELEMFGMAAVEAQACGKPVIASDHGGLKESVPESCGGRFPVGDSDALVTQVERLLDDPGLYYRCSCNALSNAKTFAWANICAKLEQLYPRVSTESAAGVM